MRICELDIVANWLVICNGWVVAQDLTHLSRKGTILVENEAVVIASKARLCLTLLSLNRSQLEIDPWLVLAIPSRSVPQEERRDNATVRARSSENRHSGTVREVGVEEEKVLKQNIISLDLWWDSYIDWSNRRWSWGNEESRSLLAVLELVLAIAVGTVEPRNPCDIRVSENEFILLLLIKEIEVDGLCIVS